PFSGSPGSSTILTTAGGDSRLRIPATVSAYVRPPASLSGRITTSRPARGCQFVLCADFAPCALVLTSNPSVAKSPVHFSPSQMQTDAFARASNSGRSNRGSSPSGSDISQPDPFG